MDAEDDHPVLRDIGEVLPEPFHLVVTESERIVIVVRENHVIHTDYVNLSAVE